jgi:hypothetical protein
MPESLAFRGASPLEPSSSVSLSNVVPDQATYVSKRPNLRGQRPAGAVDVHASSEIPGRGTSGAHDREICPGPLRTVEITTPGQPAHGPYRPRSATSSAMDKVFPPGSTAGQGQ